LQAAGRAGALEGGLFADRLEVADRVVPIGSLLTTLPDRVRVLDVLLAAREESALVYRESGLGGGSGAQRVGASGASSHGRVERCILLHTQSLLKQFRVLVLATLLVLNTQQ